MLHAIQIQLLIFYLMYYTLEYYIVFTLTLKVQLILIIKVLSTVL
jgi:hypothetical protein